MPAADPAQLTHAGSSNPPIPHAQPERLAAIARFWGMEPADVDRAGVLEIGCGDGGNLIPLAECHPGSRFLGIDTVGPLVATAEAQVRALGLRNIEFRVEGLAEFEVDGVPFDYIIAPDVYSCVDAPWRDKLLAVCRGRLTRHGIAYLHHHVYPGWRVHELLRTMMRYDARGIASPAEQLAAGRRLLALVNATLPADDGGYGELLTTAADSVLGLPDRAMFRYYLQEAGYACDIRQFVAHVREHGLQLLGDCAAGIRRRDFLPTTVERSIEAMTTDPVAREYYRDMLEQRTFRHSLVCHASAQVDRALSPARLRGLYLEGALHAENPEIPLESPASNRYIAPNDLSVTTSVPSIKAAMAHLGAAWPGYVRFEDLVAAACARIEAAADPPEPMPAAEVERLEDNLLQACLSGVIEVHSAPQPFVATPSDHPTASPLARVQVLHQSELATNRRHETVGLDLFDRNLLALLDGRASQQQLLDHLAVAAARGEVALLEEGQPVPTERALPFLQDELSRALRRLVDNALLVG